MCARERADLRKEAGMNTTRHTKDESDREQRRNRNLAWGAIYFVLVLLAAGCLGSCLFLFWQAERLG